jgi:hypothetical protein
LLHRRFRFWRLVALLLTVTVYGPVHAQAAASAEEIETAVEEVLAGSDYQRDLPLTDLSGGEGDEGSEGLWSDPDWWRNEGDAQAPDLYRPAPEQADPDSFSLDLPPELIKVLRMLMWAVLFVGGGLLLYYLVNEAAHYFRWKKQGETEGNRDADAESGEAPRSSGLEDFDSLAARGDYAGAIHALLLHCLARLSERGAELSSAMTSREILRRLQLEQQEREALSVLVRMTEVTHFGGRGASEADFTQCRALYENITADQPA